jgi:hypothetical protein
MKPSCTEFVHEGFYAWTRGADDFSQRHLTELACRPASAFGRELAVHPAAGRRCKKLRSSDTIEASMPNIRDVSDQEFELIRVRLARAYLEHKGDLGALLTDDAEIIAHVDEVTALLLAASERALRTDDRHWKERYRWFFEAIVELQDVLPDKLLDG